MSYSDFEKNNAAHGITDQDVIEQDKFFVDLRQDVSFTDPSRSIEKPSQVSLLYGEVMSDGWLVVEYTGTSCFSPVGGRISATPSSVDVTLWIVLDPSFKACSVRLNYYRATFFVAGLREGATVTSDGATIAAGVVPPFIAQLGQLAIWPDEFPSYPG